MKKSLSIIVLLSILLTSCWKAEVTVSEKKTLKSVKTVVLEKTPITEEVKLIWKVSADKEVTISAQISGIINAVRV